MEEHPDPHSQSISFLYHHHSWYRSVVQIHWPLGPPHVAERCPARQRPGQQEHQVAQEMGVSQRELPRLAVAEASYPLGPGSLAQEVAAQPWELPAVVRIDIDQGCSHEEHLLQSRA